MIRRPLTALTLPTALLLGCAGGHDARRRAPSTEGAMPPAADAAKPEEWDRELPPGVRVGCNWADDATYRPIRVLDADTGLPIAGARVDNWWEANTPHAEDWEWYHEQSLVTDADGWAFARVETAGNWWCVQADGYVPTAQIGFETEHELRPATDADTNVVEVRDWQNRPLPGVVLDIPLGCGHTASIRTVRTNARGRATLRELHPAHTDVWLRGAGVAGRNPASGGLRRVPVVDGVHVIRTGPAPGIEGVVFDHTGKPAARAVVGTREAQRGPWTEADDQGRFRLEGALPWSALTVYHWPPPGSAPNLPYAEALVQTVPGVSLTIRLPEPTRDLRVADQDQTPVVLAEGPCPLTIRFTVAEGFAAGTARIVAVRDADGRAVVREAPVVDGQGAVTLSVDVGTWTVTVGSPAGAIRPSTERISVDANVPARIDFEVRTNPVWMPRVFERGPDGSLERLIPETWDKLSIITASGVERAVASSTIPGAIHVPATGRFAVRFSPDFANHERDGQIVLDGPPADDGPDIVIPALPNEEPYRFPKPPPAEGAYPPSTLTVLLPDGSPAAEARVRVVSDLPAEFDGKATYEVDSNGRLDVAFREGDELTIDHWDGPKLEPLTATISGPGPWTVRWPQTLVEVRATDENGQPLDVFDVSFSGDSQAYGADGVARLWRTTPGPLRLWVTAEERRGHDLRVIVRPGETRIIDVVLRPDRTPEAVPESGR